MDNNANIIGKVAKDLQSTNNELQQAVKTVKGFEAFGTLSERLEKMMQIETSNSGYLKSISGYLDELNKHALRQEARIQHSKKQGGIDPLTTINNTLLTINSTLSAGIALQASMTAAMSGMADKLPNLKSMMTMNFDAIIDKFAMMYPDVKTAFKDAENNQGTEKVDPANLENIAKDSQAVALAITNLTSSITGIAGVDKTIETAGQTLTKLSALNLGRALKSFVDPLAGNKTILGLIAPQTENARKRQNLINQKLELLSGKDPANLDPATKTKIDIIDSTIAGIEASKNPGELISEAIVALSGSLKSLGDLKDVGLKSMLKFKALSRLNIGSTIAKFLNNITEGNWTKILFAQSSFDFAKMQNIDMQIYAIESKEIKTDADNKLLLNLNNTKSSMMKQVDGSKVSLSDAMSGVSAAIGVLNSIGEKSFSNYYKFKAITKLKYGVVIASFINDIYSGMKDIVGTQFKEVMEQFNSINSTIESFVIAFPKNLLKIKLISLLDPGEIFSEFFSSMYVDISKVTKMNIEEEAKKIGSSNVGLLGFADIIKKQFETIGEVFSGIGEVANNAKSLIKAVFILEFAGGMLSKSMVKTMKSLINLIGNEKTGLVALTTNNEKLEKIKGTDVIDKIKTLFFAVGDIINTISEIKFHKLLKVGPSLTGANVVLSKLIGKEDSNLAKLTNNKIKSDGIIDKIIIIKDRLKEMSQGLNEKQIKLAFEIINNITQSVKGLAGGAIFIPFASITVTFVLGIIKVLQFMAITSAVTYMGVLGFMRSVKGLGKSIIFLAIAAPLIPIAVVAVGFIIGIMWLFGKLSNKLVSFSIFRGSRNLSKMGMSMVKFILAAVLVGFILVKAFKYVMLGIGLIVGVMLLFSILSKFARPIGKGGNAIAMMAIGILVFTIAALALTLLMKVDPLRTFAGFALIAFAGLIFFGLGYLFKYIAKGAAALALVSVAIFIFTLSILFLNLVMKSIDMQNMLNAGIILGVLIGATLLLGLMFMTALKGVAIIAAIGVSLILFSHGVLLLSIGLKNLTMEKLKVAGVLFGVLIGAVVAIGAIMATGIGAGIVFMAIGALVAMGVALIVLSMGINELSRAKIWKKEEAKNFKNMMKYLVDGFLELSTSEVLGVRVPNPIKMASLLASIPLVIGIGVGLKSIAKALKDSMDVKWEQIPIKKIKKVLVGLGEAFAAVGSSNSGGAIGSTLKALSFGLLGPNKVKDGIKSVLGSAEALKSIGKGIREFWQMTKDMGDDAFAKKGEKSLIHKITVTVGAINDAFSRIGASANSGFSYMKMFFGTDFKKSDTEEGIKAVKHAGRSLKSISEGMIEFKKFADTLGPDAFRKDEKGNYIVGSLGYNIANVISLVNGAFASIGKSANGDFSLMKAVFGTDFKKSDTEEGINSVKRVGRILVDIANGLKAWSDLKSQNIDITVIGKNIKDIITTISNAFADIAKNNGSSKFSIAGISIGMTNSVKEGIDSVKGVGRELINIANAVKEWNNLSKQNIDIAVIKNNIKLVITAIGEVFGDLGKKYGGSKLSIGGFEIGATSAMKTGIDSVRGIGKILLDVASGLKPFIDLQAGMEITEGGKKTRIKLDIEKLKSNIKDIISVMLNVVSAVGSKDLKFREDWLPGAPADGYSIELIDKSKEILLKGFEAIKPIKDIVSIINSINLNDFNKKKTMLQEIAVLPLQLVEVIADMYNKIEPKVFDNVIKNVMPDLENGFNRILKIVKDVSSIETSKKNKDDLRPILSLSSDTEQFFNVINKQIRPDSNKKLNYLSSFIETYSKNADKFKVFAKSHEQYTKDFKEQIKLINELKIDKVQKVIDLHKELINLMKLDKNVFQENIKLLKEYMWAIKDAANSNVESLEKMTSGLNSYISAQKESQNNNMQYQYNNQSTNMQQTSLYNQQQLLGKATLDDVVRKLSELIATIDDGIEIAGTR